MRLADFILTNNEAILADWEAFAREIWPAGVESDIATLRDHAGNILRATARDMQAEQSDAEQSDKAQGNGRDTAESDRLDDASVDHGLGRVTSGFNLPLVVAEYRALRASVIRLWREGCAQPDGHDLVDLTRFNESIDQSLTRAVQAYTERVDRSRQTFLAILGHDLRNPLAAMRLVTELLQRDSHLSADAQELVSILDTSTTAMAGMVTDLLDFARTALGDRIPIFPAPADLAQICRDVVGEVQIAHPRCEVNLQTRGDLAGAWDAARLRQVIANLVGNAVQHGRDAGAIDVLAAADDAGAVTVAVHNAGEPIPPELLPTIFEPLVRGPSTAPGARRRSGSIGLGLYIARAIATGHGGTITVASTAASGTTFTLSLPRHTNASP
jgi:hypothetical protein